jgi:glucose/arabinose dehydrogenase
LGLALVHDAKDKIGNDNSENTKYRDNSIIYLYYSEKVINGTVGDPCVPNSCNVNYAVNNLMEYGFKDGYLVKRAHLITIPFDKDNPAFEHIGGAISLGPDDNIYIPTGDGRPCYSYEDCKTSMSGGPLDSLTANSVNGSAPIGAGGILFVPLDGDLTHNKGILGDQYPLNLYYAYGIRNSFGIDFDPVTGKLWDTENGPFYGDEINLVEPGFNSGWTKFQGMWPIKNYSDLIINGPVGSPRGFLNESYDLGNGHVSLFDFNGNGKYSDPEFTWNQSVGVTSIKFYNSDKLGKEYENDMFVATSSQGGWIYHFDLDKDRKNIKLKADLEDKVAGNQTELLDVYFARGFGSITDLEVSPDGYLYVLSFGKGAIYKISPKVAS